MAGDELVFRQLLACREGRLQAAFGEGAFLVRAITFRHCLGVPHDDEPEHGVLVQRLPISAR